MASRRPSGAVSWAFACAICCRSPLWTAPASLARASATSVKTVCSCFAYPDRLDQVGDEVSAPLQLDFDLRGGGIHLLVIGLNRVVAATRREHQADEGDEAFERVHGCHPLSIRDGSHRRRCWPPPRDTQPRADPL